MTFQSEFNDPDKILFFDYAAVADMDGCVRKWHQPVKQGIVLRPERAYEGGMTLPVAAYPSPDGRTLICHYSCINSAARFPDLAKEKALHLSCIAESDDGLHWTRPELGRVAFRGSTRNNIAPLSDLEFKIVQDPHDPDPNRRYKAMALVWAGGESGIVLPRGKRCFASSFSADGLTWTPPRALPEFVETGDTSGLSYDERRRQFLFTTRKRGYWLSDAFPAFAARPVKKGMPDGRWVAVSASSDFETWTPLENILARDAKDEDGVEFYCACIFPYANLYLGLLRRFHAWHGLMDTELVWSLDGLRWNRSYYRQPFLGWGGLGEADWCFGDILNAKPVRRGGEILFLYEARNHVHAPHAVTGTPNADAMDACMGLATLRLDGFCSVEAGTMGGHLLTEPIPAAGRRLEMNARTVAGGVMRIDLVDAALHPLTPAPFVFAGDDTAAPLSFGGAARLPATPDGAVRLKIEMTNAALFSLAIR